MTLVRIAHRGNIAGPLAEKENHPNYIDEALHSGFDAEIDLWGFENKLFLGHDKAQHNVAVKWLLERKDKLWIHCKNARAIELMASTDANWFFHHLDDYTLTSHGYVWSYPGREIVGSKFVLLTFESTRPDIVGSGGAAYAVCGDYVEKW